RVKAIRTNVAPAVLHNHAPGLRGLNTEADDVAPAALLADSRGHASSQSRRKPLGWCWSITCMLIEPHERPRLGCVETREEATVNSPTHGAPGWRGPA